MKLSENFTLEELTKTNSGLPNIPSAKEIEALKQWCIHIGEPVRAYFKKKYPQKLIMVIPSSGFRSKAVNKAAGSTNPDSQHTKGEAVDFEIPGVSNAEIWQYIHDNLNFDQLIAEKLSIRNGSDGWIHCSFSVAHARKDAKSWLGGSKYPKGLHYVS